LHWKVYRALGLTPTEKRTLDMNDSQIAWAYLNVIEDQKELQEMVYQFMDWYKWYVNPVMARKVEEMEKSAVSMEDDDFIGIVAESMRKEGKSEEETYDALVEAGMINENK